MAGFSRHYCVPTPIFQINEIIPDLTCELCKLNFPTENLYYWHDCFIKKNGACWKCKKRFVKKNILFKHVIHCTFVEPVMVEPVKAPIAITPVTTKATINISRIDGKQKIVKSEPGSILEIEDVSHIEIPDSYLQDELLLKKPVVILERHILEKKRRGRPKKFQKPFAVKTLNAIEPTEESVLDVPVLLEDEEPVLEEIPIIENPIPIISSVTTLVTKIKQEVLNSDYGDFDAELARNIKKEKTDEEKRKAKERKNTNSPKPTLKLKIKKEHGTLNASFVEQQQGTSKEITSPLPSESNISSEVTSELPNDTTTTVAPSTSLNIAEVTTTVTLPKRIKDKARTNKKKRIFKNPFAALAMRIKKERIDPKETISVPVISQVASAQDLNLPKISSVQSVSKVQPIVRVKMEKPSPEHEVEYNYDEEENEEEGEKEEEQQQIREETNENCLVPCTEENVPKVIPVCSVLPEVVPCTEENVPDVIPVCSVLPEVKEKEISSVPLNMEVDENKSESIPETSIPCELEIASVASVPCSTEEQMKDISDKLKENKTEHTQESLKERSEIDVESSVPVSSEQERRTEQNPVTEEINEEIIKINSDSHENVKEIQSEKHVSDDLQTFSPEKEQSSIAILTEVPYLNSNEGETQNMDQNESDTVMENNCAPNMSDDVVMKEESDRSITETFSQIKESVLNSIDARLSFVMSTDVLMEEKPSEILSKIDEKSVLNCLETTLASALLFRDVRMQEEEQDLTITNLEEENSNTVKDYSENIALEDEVIISVNERLATKDKEELIKPNTYEDSNSTNTESSISNEDNLIESELSILKENTNEIIEKSEILNVAEMIDETLNEIISSTVDNSEHPTENFNHKIIENNSNFQSGNLLSLSRDISTSSTERNLEESHQNILNNIHDLDDISSSSEGIQNTNDIENNLLEGSPISSEPMSEAEEDKLLNDGCDTSVSFDKTNVG